MRTKEWQETSIALAKPSAEQSSSPPCRSSFGAKAIECTRMSSLPQRCRIWSNTASSWPGTATLSAPVIGASSASRQRLDMGARLVVQPGDGELGAGVAERLGAAIGDRLVVGDADDQRLVPGQDGSDGVVHGLPQGMAAAALARRAAATRTRDGARGKPRELRVGAAGQDDRHAGAEHDAGGVGAGQERQALGQHVAGLEIGHDQHVGAAGDRRDDLLDRGGLGLIALSSASGPSRMPPVIWPRSAILHSAAASSVDGTLGLTVSMALRIATRTGSVRPAPAPGRSRSARCRPCHLERRRDVHGGVGDDQGLGMARHVHDEAVADAPGGADAGIARHDRAHQLVGMQAALHQGFGPPGAHQLDRLGGRIVAVLRRRRSRRRRCRARPWRPPRVCAPAARPGSAGAGPCRAASTAPSSEAASQG